MAIYLGLGSNVGDRRQNLRDALKGLADAGIAVDRVSPVVESPALLPRDAPPEWNRPYLNLVAKCVCDETPASLLARIKDLEHRLGREDGPRWMPRPIDIDILLFDDAVIDTDDLVVPHPAMTLRPFVLTPLAALESNLPIPGLGRTAMELNFGLGQRIPLWMGIINLTPDSFSDGGENASWAAVEARLDGMLEAGVHILDFGAESTRPGAEPLSARDEWARLEPVLEGTVARLGSDPLRPLISVDTYHPEVAGAAIDLGVDIVNDVSGLTQPGMLDIAAESRADFIAMHNLGLPADPARTFPGHADVVAEVEAWLDRQIEVWTRRHIDLGRIVFDPGVGFGKNPVQSLDLLREITRFTRKGVRLLVGHSRKSFMKGQTSNSREARDLATLGGSLQLVSRGVDFLRVHNVEAHIDAYRGWALLQPVSQRVDPTP